MITIKIDTKIFYIIGILAFLCVVANATSSQSIQHTEEESFLIEDSGQLTYQEEAHAKADNVQNVIDNMVNGDVSAWKAKDYIEDEKFYTKNNIDANAVETQVNQAYIAYLNSALDVVTTYSNYGKDSKEFKEMYGIMQEKKDLI